MRGYHESLFLAVHACSKLGASYAPDCEQGAFHDYWISLRGADDTTSPIHAVRSPRKLCAEYSRYAVQCWYRYWNPADARADHRGAAGSGAIVQRARGAQREGCIAAPRRTVFNTPFAQLSMCAKLRAADAARVYAASRIRSLRESRGRSSRSSATAGGCRRGAVTACAAWFGDVQRRRERAVPRARVPAGAGVVTERLRSGGKTVARPARDLFLTSCRHSGCMVHSTLWSALGLSALFGSPWLVASVLLWRFEPPGRGGLPSMADLARSASDFLIQAYVAGLTGNYPLTGGTHLERIHPCPRRPQQSEARHSLGIDLLDDGVHARVPRRRACLDYLWRSGTRRRRVARALPEVRRDAQVPPRQGLARRTTATPAATTSTRPPGRSSTSRRRRCTCGSTPCTSWLALDAGSRPSSWSASLA